MINVNIEKAKDIVHSSRRVARSSEFQPLDIKATIPSEAAQAEIERQKIREKYSVLQQDIDSAKTVEELKGILDSINNP